MPVPAQRLPRIEQFMSLAFCFLIVQTSHQTGDEDSFVYQPNSPHSSIKFQGGRSSNSETEETHGHGHGAGLVSAVAVSDPQEEHIPILLWWTERTFPHFNGNLMKIQCGTSQRTCFSTSDRRHFSDNRARGIIFYGSDFDFEDLPFPRDSQHEWALLHEESPMNNYVFSHEPMIKLFNHTATFRRESDYPLSSQNIYSLNYLLKPPLASLLEKNENRKKGYAPVLFVQSHCGVASDRDEYVRELMKYLEIDSYGKCLNNKELPKELQDPVESMESNAFLKFIGRYKFHLAFENALCIDYMTEKLFRPLHVGSVPIVRGSPVASEWMPNNHSAILVDDFSSPRELAEYIKHLDASDEEYEKYLQFKKSGITNQFLKEQLKERTFSVQAQHNAEHYLYMPETKPNFMVGFECYVCERVSERLQNERLHTLDSSVKPLPSKSANNSHQGCPSPCRAVKGLPLTQADSGWKYSLFGSNDEGDWLNYAWYEDYQFNLEKALAIEEMVRAEETDGTQAMKYWQKINSARSTN